MGYRLNKYITIFKISWQDQFVYRFNFLVWRLRSILSILAAYFFWFTIYQDRNFIGSYSGQSMITYVFGTFILADLIVNSVSVDVGADISDGNLSNWLIRPLNYFYFWLAKDLANKILNLILCLVEIIIIFILLKPQVTINLNLLSVLAIIIVLPLGLVLNFYLNFIISLMSFWWPEHSGWPQRFFFNIILTFLIGMYFPFDIFPKVISNILQFLPTGFIVYFPMQIYLNRLNPAQIFFRLIIMFAWIAIVYKINLKTWRLGLKKYSSEGR